MIANASCEQNRFRSTGLMNSKGNILSRLLSEMSVALEHGATILLLGEAGTGKKHLSQLLFGKTESEKKHFLCYDCSLLTDRQIEHQIFSRLDRVDADCSFMLIRKIESLSWPMQFQFLNRIDSAERTSSAGNDIPCPQSRIIIASQYDLRPFVEEGSFRTDLYYRLNSYRFELPPLRNRLDEIAGLTRQFVRDFCRRFEKRVDRIDDSLMSRLMAYHWPGNIRELKYVIERAVMYCENGILNDATLPDYLKMDEHSPQSSTSKGSEKEERQSVSLDCNLTLEEQLAKFERELISQALEQNQHCRTDAARELGVSRVTLYNKMKRLGLDTLKPID